MSKIQCPNCKRKDFETTGHYSSVLPPNGSMVKCLLPYHIDWLCSSTTKGAEMTCPECLSPLVIKGKLNVIRPTHVEKEESFEKELEAINAKAEIFICDICGKEAKSALGLNSHKRSHTGEPPHAKPNPIPNVMF